MDRVRIGEPPGPAGRASEKACGPRLHGIYACGDITRASRRADACRDGKAARQAGGAAGREALQDPLPVLSRRARRGRAADPAQRTSSRLFACARPGRLAARLAPQRRGAGETHPPRFTPYKPHGRLEGGVVGKRRPRPRRLYQELVGPAGLGLPGPQAHVVHVTSFQAYWRASPCETARALSGWTPLQICKTVERLDAGAVGERSKARHPPSPG